MMAATKPDDLATALGQIGLRWGNRSEGVLSGGPVRGNRLA